MRVTNLACEHVPLPLAVESRSPHFSWHNENIDSAGRPNRGGRQSAYQVIVSEQRASIDAEIGDAWDTGKVRGAQSYGVAYSGTVLKSFTRYFWRVRTWDQKGVAGEFSATARFETGAFAAGDWVASWITRNDLRGEASEILKVSGSIHKKQDLKSRHLWAAYYSKAFEVDGAVSRARAYASGLGYYELAVNGSKVGDHVLDPGQTDYRSGALYAALDLNDHIRPGVNTLLFTVANGRHIDAYGYGTPRGILQILLEYEDGRRLVFGTDTSWHFGYGPVHENGIYLGEWYDAREEKRVESAQAEATRECRSARNMNATAPTRRKSGVLRAERAKSVPLRAQLMPPIRITHAFAARSVTNPQPDTYVFDFGQNFAGVVRLQVAGPRGSRVTLRYAELVESDGSLHTGTNREAPASDVYILKGGGLEIYQPRFTYHGFRYVEVTGYPGVPVPESLTGLALHTDIAQTGSFSCSNGLINRIHENTLWSGRSNLMSIPTDCPQRGERMGWLGDAQLASEQAMCNFDMAAFYAKYLDDIQRSQHEDGSLSDVTPAYWPLFPSDPAWATAYVTLAWHMYNSYGDVRVLDSHYSSLRRYVDFLATKADRHIIRTLGKYGDWCPPGSVFPKQTPIELTSTWYYYHDTLCFSEIASVLGKKQDAQRYGKRAADILAAFNREFLDKEGKYATLKMSPIDYAPGQTSQALPLYLDMVPAKSRAAAFDKLVKTIVDKFDSHVDTGIVGTRYIFEVLRDNGRADLAYRMITQESYPGWGYMIARGATTIWERWEDLRGLGMNSHNHIMLGSVDAWFYRTIGGIIQTAPGWKKARIAPMVLGDLRHASARVQTLHGSIEVVWKLSGSEFTLDVSIPVGIEAAVRVPADGRTARLTESGRRLRPSDTVRPAGITSVTVSDSAFDIAIESGSYHFVRTAR